MGPDACTRTSTSRPAGAWRYRMPPAPEPTRRPTRPSQSQPPVASNTCEVTHLSRPVAAGPSEAGIAWARERVEQSVPIHRLPKWEAVADREAEISLSECREDCTNPALLAEARSVFIKEGRCREDVRPAFVAALIYERRYSARLMTLLRDRGGYYGSDDEWLPAAQFRWPDRTGRLLQQLATASGRDGGAFASLRADGDGFLVLDGALSEEEASAARAELSHMDSQGQFKRVESQSSVRHDRIGWVGIDRLALISMPALGLVARLLRALPAEVEAQLGQHDRSWRLRVPTRLQAAVYDGSRERPSHYHRHYDASHDIPMGRRNPRRLTCILYLNSGWDAARDGGALRVYHPKRAGEAAADERHVDVAPVAGRLVLFDSRRVEHEVRQAYAPRWALTLWAGVEVGDDER